jgi:hypothetical protein
VRHALVPIQSPHTILLDPDAHPIPEPERHLCLWQPLDRCEGVVQQRLPFRRSSQLQDRPRVDQVVAKQELTRL